MVSYHPARRSRSALAYGSRSTATAETTSTGSYTTNGDATEMGSRPLAVACGFDESIGEFAGGFDHPVTEAFCCLVPRR